MAISRRQFGAGVVALAGLGRAAWGSAESGDGKLRVLIVDGINNHDWKTATAGIRRILEDSGRFRVEVSTTPAREAAAKDWDAWRPDFKPYDVVVNNFNGGEGPDGIQWPEPVEKALEAYVEGGGGLVSFHAANNAFLPWVAYNEMIGLGWRKKTYGRGVQISDADEVIFIPKGSGLEPGHPPRLDFQVHLRGVSHPITNGLPPVWLHPSEQLTHGQHGPADGLTILTYAHSPVSLANEPMDWVRSYGKGRVYTTMLGHTWVGEPNPNLDCVGLQTLLARGVEWAATGRVTVPVPKNVPGPDRVSLRALHI
jgi:type 1 glutamine amidotransferase